MNKLLMTTLSIGLVGILLGCRTHPVTPDESWHDYARFYRPTGEKVAVPENANAVDVRQVKSSQATETVENLKAQGLVAIGSFQIDGGTEISRAAVLALAQKLNATTVVWSSVHAVSANSALPNPDMGLVGMDNTQLAQMNANRPDQTTSEQLLETRHTIWMLGKKAK